MNEGDTTYAMAVGAALVAAFLPFYVEGALGIIDPPGGPIVLIELGVVAVLAAGAVAARFRARGMARALLAAALAQALAAVIMLIVVPSHPASPLPEVLGLNAIFVAAFCGAAWLFRRAARRRAAARAPREG